jgi:hypothetical protein
MKIDTQTLQVEITIAPQEGRKGGQRSCASGSKVPDPPRIPRITRLMALAIKFQDMVDRGEVRDYADLARLGYVTRARITQIMNLLMLAPDIQEEIIGLGPARARTILAERQVRSILQSVLWDRQRQAWRQQEQALRSH